MLRHAMLALALGWVNAYICRDFFTSDYTGHTNSMQGYWMAIARLGSWTFWEPQWWRYWDGGMPAEFTYAPLLPGLTALWAKLTGSGLPKALQSVTGVFYCLTPVTLFAMASVLSRRVWWSFAAALVYSLLAPGQLVIPDEAFAWHRIGDARRLYLMAVWDETPHVAALTMLPLVVLFVVLGIEQGRRRWWAAAGAAMALAVLANAFGGTIIALALVPVLFSYGRDRLVRNAIAVAVVGATAYLVIAPLFPPSLLSAIRTNAAIHGDNLWTTGSVTALALLMLAWTAAVWLLDRLQATAWMRFVLLLAVVFTTIPFVYQHWNRTFIPQPGRYKVEAEMALSLLLVFVAATLIGRLPVRIRLAVAALALALAAEQVVSHRKFEKSVVRSQDITRTVEYRAAKWLEADRGSGRVFVPGSIAQWLNVFADLEQFGGSSWSTAYNGAQQAAYWELYALPASLADRGILWLKAYGVRTAVIVGKTSPEFWKAFADPALFEGRLPVLWREQDTTVYRVSGGPHSPAHAVPSNAVLQRTPLRTEQTPELARFVAAIEEPSAPADFRWTGPNSAEVRALKIPPGQVLHVQVSHHPGWKATVDGRAAPVARDGLGLMTVAAQCSAPCTVRLAYDGGFELRFLRLASAAGAVVLGCWWGMVWKRRLVLH